MIKGMRGGGYSRRVLGLVFVGRRLQVADGEHEVGIAALEVNVAANERHQIYVSVFFAADPAV